MLKLIIPLTLITVSRPKNWPCSSVALLIISLFSFKLFVPSMNTYEASMVFSSDRLSSPLIILTIWMTALMFMASNNTFASAQNIQPLTTTMLALCSILLLAFASNNLIVFYIMFEASLLPTVMLIITWGYQPERLQASTYMMIYMITASFPLLAILTLIFTQNNHMNMLTAMLPPNLMNTPLWWLSTIIAFMVKLPLYMLHLWLPKAHVEAPIAGSMILAGLLLKLGGYGFMRLSAIFQLPSLSLSNVLTPVALWGAILTGLSCLRQTDLKALIAYSSVAHMGLFLAAVTSMSSFGWAGALITMLAHGLVSPMLFVLANLSYQSTNTRSLFLTKGLMSLFPSLTMWWFFAAAANMSAPPSINLLGELLMLAAVLSLNTLTMFPLMILTFLTAAYSLHLYTNTQHGPKPLFLTCLSTPQTTAHPLMFFHFAPTLLLITNPLLLTLPTSL